MPLLTWFVVYCEIKKNSQLESAALELIFVAFVFLFMILIPTLILIPLDSMFLESVKKRQRLSSTFSSYDLWKVDLFVFLAHSAQKLQFWSAHFFQCNFFSVLDNCAAQQAIGNQSQQAKPSNVNDSTAKRRWWFKN